MQEVKQVVICFQETENYREFKYLAGECYLIQDIPRGYIQKWKNYGHLELEETKDIEVHEDSRSAKFIKDEYDAMIFNEEKRASELAKSKKKKDLIPEKKIVEETIEEVPEIEVESEEEENIDVKEELIEEVSEIEEKPTRRKRK